MTKRKLHISIPNPCDQDWNAMAPQGDGRFCEVCQQCVVDFSTKTDRELIEIFSRSTEKVCGRFRADQLNRNIILPQQARISGWRLFALTFGALFTTNFAQAQTSKPKQPVIKNFASAKPVHKNQKYLVISGTVKTRDGKPLQEAFIGLKNKPGILASTDSLGKFRFRLPVSWISNSKKKRVVLTFSRVNYHVFEQPVSTLKNHSFAITLDALPGKTQNEAAVAEVTYEQPLIGPDKVRETLIMGGSDMVRFTVREFPKESLYMMKHDLNDHK